MLVKKQRKKSIAIPFGIAVLVFYYMLRVMTLVKIVGKLKIGFFGTVLESITHLDTPLILNTETISASMMASIFSWMCYETYRTSQKKNIQENSHGSAEWGTEKDTLTMRDKKNYLNNQIFTESEIISRDMLLSKRSRNVLLLGRPGTGKSRNYFKPNILNTNGSIVVTDPKGELLRDCAISLVNKGWTIKVLNLVEKWKSSGYNPFMYIKKLPVEAYTLDQLIDCNQESFNEYLAEDDVMSLINLIMKSTKAENIQSNADPFWEKGEMLYLQALFFYVLGNYAKEKQNFTTVMELIRMSEPNGEGISELDKLFMAWEQKEPNSIGIMQYKHFKIAAQSPKTMMTIVLTATARLAPFNIAEVKRLTDLDDMELNRIGKPGNDGKIAWFIITNPKDNTFDFIGNIFYSQVFSMIDINATDNDGFLATPCDLYMDEWAQLGEIPRFIEMLAYVRGLNCGVTVGLQSLSQLKKVYKDNWETVLDCCDYLLFMGSRSKETLEYMSSMLGKKTWYKKSTGRTYSRQGSSSKNWDVIGRELATVDELAEMPKGKCILLVAGMKPFYSNIYKLEKHPCYNELFEPRDKERTRDNLYDHFEHLKIDKEDKRVHKQFDALGLPFVNLSKGLQARKASEHEIKKIEKEILLSNSRIFFEQLNIKN